MSLEEIVNTEQDEEKVDHKDKPALTPEDAVKLLVASMKLVLITHPHPAVSVPMEVDVMKLAMSGKADNDPVWNNITIIHQIPGRACYEICKALLSGPQLLVPHGADA